jgi:Domain of unknown function (DUF4340)
VRLLLALAAVAALLAVYILAFERHHPTRDQERAGRVRLVADYDRHRVRRVTIARAGLPPFALVRAPAGGADAGGGAATGAWRVLPADRPGDEAAVEELLTELDFAEADRDADLTPAAAGLEPPRVRLELDLGGSRPALALGAPDATGRGVFVGADGARVRVGPRRLLDLADRDASAFRDRRLVPFALAGPRALALEWGARAEGTPTATVMKVASAGGRWTNEAGEWVSGPRVSEALHRLAELRVERFVDAPASPPPPRRTLEISTSEGERTVLLARDGGCAAVTEVLLDRQGPAGADWLCVAADPLHDLWRALDAAHARDSRLVGAAPEAVTAVEVAAAGRRLALERAHGRWRFVAPAVGYGADSAAVDDWLADLGRERLELTSAAAGAPAPGTGRKLALTTPQGTESLEVTAGRGGAGAVVRRAGEPAPARAPASVVALVDPDPLRFRERNVLDLARFDAQRLRISSGSRPPVEVVKGQGESWQVVAPPAAALDGAALDRVLAALTNLRAQRFVAPETALSVERTLDLTERPPGVAAPLHHVVEVGPRRADGCLARSDEKGARTTFVLAPSVCDDLETAVVR